MQKTFDVHYAHRRSAVVLEADLHRGWRKLKKTYGFFQFMRVPYKDDLSVRAQLSLIAQPGTFDEWAATFPDVEFATRDQALSYNLAGKKLTMTVSLSPEQLWRQTEQGRPELFIADTPWLRINESRYFDLRAWIVFHEPSPPPIPDVRLWVENRLVLPGGQFESQRSRH